MSSIAAPSSDFDIIFLVYFLDRNVRISNSDTFCLAITDPEGNEEKASSVEDAVKLLFAMNNEEFNGNKTLNQFMSSRKSPSKKFKPEASILCLLNYIWLVRNMIEKATLKDIEYIRDVTKILGFEFYPEFFLIDVQAGLIKEIGLVDGMDSLYCEKVMMRREYKICSGLRAHYKEEELQGKTFLFVANAKKAKFKEVVSEGMICCTSDADKVEALAVSQSPGTRLRLEGIPDIFGDIERGTIDLKKQNCRAILEEFKIVDNHLRFRNKIVLCGETKVKANIKSGPVS